MESSSEVVVEEKETEHNVDSNSNDVTAPKMITVLIICLLNLVNFVDRFAIPGMLPQLIDIFKLSDLQGGLLQSSFAVSYVVFAPLVGYLGDRYSRRTIMATGVLVWSLITFAGTFTTSFGWLIALRCFGGIGEASFASIGPAIIGDLFVGNNRTKMLTLFYFTTLFGGGLGFVCGSGMLQLTGSWQWGLRVAPIVSFISVFLIVFVMMDPPRGQSEGSHLASTSWRADLKYLFSNASFMLSTLGSAALIFVVGALASWGPKLLYFGRKTQNDTAQSVDDISLTYGILTIGSGVLGVVSGSLMGQKLRKYVPYVDAVICGGGLLISAAFFYASFVLSQGSIATDYVMIFFGLYFLNLNWALVGDILLYVVIPPRRASGEALQILIGHVLGDAGSPFIIGWIADVIRPSIANDSSDYQEYKALQYALFVVLFVEVLGGFLFFANACYLVRDRAKVDQAIASETSDPDVFNN